MRRVIPCPNNPGVSVSNTCSWVGQRATLVNGGVQVDGKHESDFTIRVALASLNSVRIGTELTIEPSRAYVRAIIDSEAPGPQA